MIDSKYTRENPERYVRLHRLDMVLKVAWLLIVLGMGTMLVAADFSRTATIWGAMAMGIAVMSLAQVIRDHRHHVHYRCQPLVEDTELWLSPELRVRWNAEAEMQTRRDAQRKTATDQADRGGEL
jgi:hypothetical protein